jgi:hypothetical protein
VADGLPDGFEKLIDPATVEAVLKVECNDRCHAAGKKTDVETFVRVDGYWRPWPRFVATRKDLPGYGAPAPTPATLREYRRPDGSTRRSFSCNLCEGHRPRGQAPLEVNEATLQWVLESAWQGLLKTGVTQRVPTVSLRLLHLIASGRPQQ